MHSCSRVAALAALAAFLIAFPTGARAAGAQPPRPPATDSAGLHAAATAFLTAFDGVDWEPFAATWTSDATVFMPDADKQRRHEGRDAVLAYFRELFSSVRQRAGTSPPSLNILARVRDLSVVPIGPDAGLVSFHLGEGDLPGRRTVVWRRDPASARWQIVHLHASRMPAPASAR